jgi:hypothetical protein
MSLPTNNLPIGLKDDGTGTQHRVHGVVGLLVFGILAGGSKDESGQDPHQKSDPAKVTITTSPDSSKLGVGGSSGVGSGFRRQKIVLMHLSSKPDRLKSLSSGDLHSSGKLGNDYETQAQGNRDK